MKLYLKEFNSKIGIITVISDGSYIINLSFGKYNYTENTNIYQEKTSIEQQTLPTSNDLCELCEKEVLDYLNGKHTTFTVKTRLVGTPYQITLWNALKKIPYGKTISYKELTNMIRQGSPRSCGGALSKNPIPLIYPCHRVIRADGQIGGFDGGYKIAYIKKNLINLEKDYQNINLL